MIDYEYTQVNRLDEPHSYMYTKFEGHDFLNSYFDNRKINIERFQTIASNDGNTEVDSELIFKLMRHFETFFNEASVKAEDDWLLLFNWKNNRINAEFKTDSKILENMISVFTALNIEDVVKTEDLLNGLLANQLTGVQEVNTKEWLDRLVQRFEVSKKLYELYPPGFRKGSGSTKIVRLYWLFGLSLCLYYVATGSVKYLSTQLKISDLLCSLPEKQLIGQVSTQGLSMLLLAEIQSIKLLTLNIKGDLLDFK